MIGYPVAQSLSPKLFRYWFRQYGIDGEYKAYPVSPHGLEDFIKTMAENNFAGCNVTIPHKEKVLGFLDEITALASDIGAANTLAVKDGKLLGTNTDAYGFTENILPSLTRKHKAVVLGAGGAAKAVCYGLINLGFSEILVVNRTPEKAQALIAQLSGTLKAGAWSARAQYVEQADLLVNTTCLGMVGQGPLEMDLSLLPKTALVTDIVYKPLITPLLAQAQTRGNPVVDGLGMLLYQAVPGFEAWFGVKPEVTPELRAYMLGDGA